MTKPSVPRCSWPRLNFFFSAGDGRREYTYMCWLYQTVGSWHIPPRALPSLMCCRFKSESWDDRGREKMCSPQRRFSQPAPSWLAATSAVHFLQVVHVDLKLSGKEILHPGPKPACLNERCLCAGTASLNWVKAWIQKTHASFFFSPFPCVFCGWLKCGNWIS